MMDRKPVAKHVESCSKNKFENLVHLVGFIVRIEHASCAVKNVVVAES